MRGNAIKCWYCEHINECEKYFKDGCERFSRWYSPTTLCGFARKYRIAPNTLKEWLEKGIPYAKQKIKKRTGKTVKISHAGERKRWRIVEEVEL